MRPLTARLELDSLVESIAARLLATGPASSATRAARPAGPLLAEDTWAAAASILRPCRSGPDGKKSLSAATEVAQLTDRMRSAEFSLGAIERRAEETNKNACALGEQLRLFQADIEERIREIREFSHSAQVGIRDFEPQLLAMVGGVGQRLDVVEENSSRLLGSFVLQAKDLDAQLGDVETQLRRFVLGSACADPVVSRPHLQAVGAHGLCEGLASDSTDPVWISCGRSRLTLPALARAIGPAGTSSAPAAPTSSTYRTGLARRLTCVKRRPWAGWRSTTPPAHSPAPTWRLP